MSSYLFGVVSREREEADQDRSDSAQPPGFRTQLDALMGLVPAEALLFHGIFTVSATDMEESTQDGLEADPAAGTPVAETTEPSESDEEFVTTVTSDATLQFVFWAGIALAIFLYWAGHRKRRRLSLRPDDLDRDFADIGRALIAGGAFVLWMILQRSPAFEAVAPDTWDRTLVGAIATAAAIVFLFFTGAAAAQDNREQPK